MPVLDLWKSTTPSVQLTLVCGQGGSMQCSLAWEGSFAVLSQPQNKAYHGWSGCTVYVWFCVTHILVHRCNHSVRDWPGFYAKIQIIFVTIRGRPVTTHGLVRFAIRENNTCGPAFMSFNKLKTKNKTFLDFPESFICDALN